MSPRVAIVGGGSFQWVPKLVVDLATTPALAAATIVLHDIDPGPLPRMAAWVEHVADRLGVGLTVETTTDRRAALPGADFVVATISTGGFDAMRHDLAVPRRHGVVQSVGDTVGPGGISRALRNIPVFLAIAADMAECCPDAWLLNLTNPMTTICRAVTRETPVRTVGLCHELTKMRQPARVAPRRGGRLDPVRRHRREPPPADHPLQRRRCRRARPAACPARRIPPAPRSRCRAIHPRGSDPRRAGPRHALDSVVTCSRPTG